MASFEAIQRVQIRKKNQTQTEFRFLQSGKLIPIITKMMSRKMSKMMNKRVMMWLTYAPTIFLCTLNINTIKYMWTNRVFVKKKEAYIRNPSRSLPSSISDSTGFV
jgi:hypothetical protein